jgi:osmotically-inducible protein OsmY
MKTPAAFIAMGLLAGAVACGPKEPDYDSVAKNALSRAGFEYLSTSYDRDAKVLHVTGMVTTKADKDRAGEVAAEAVAPPAQVANEVTVQGRDTENADDLDSGLTTRLKNLIEQDKVLAQNDIAFDVRNGVVTITGEVASAVQKDRVGEIAKTSLA